MQTVKQNALRKGFTLLEIMIVVMIIGMLATITGTAVINRLKTAKIRIAESFVKSIGANSLEMYYSENGFYPTTEQGVKALVEKPGSAPVPQAWLEPYLKQPPLDPWGQAYQYACPATKSKADFDLWSAGPDRQIGTSDDIGNWQAEAVQ